MQGDGRKRVLTNEQAAVSNKAALWIKDPLAILADGAERGVVVKDGRIVELVPAGDDPATPVDGDLRRRPPRRAAGPDQHPPSFLPDADPRRARRRSTSELFPWLQALYPIWAGLTPEVLELARHAWRWPSCCCRAAPPRPTITMCFRPGSKTRIDIEVAAARRLGIRVTVTRGSMNLSQRDGGLPPDSVVQDEDTILADSERVIDRYHQRADGAMVQIALAPCSPFSVHDAR